MKANQNFKPDRAGIGSQAPISSYHSDVSRRLSDIGAVSLEGRVVSPDHIFSTASAMRESIEETFGKLPHDAQLRADRKNYELRDNAPNTFGKMKDSSE